MFNIFLDGGAKELSFMEQYGSIIMIVLMIVAMWFVMIRPQKKKQKREQELKNSVIVGDSVMMMSGISGKVIAIKDDEVTIENGLARTQLTFSRAAIANITVKTEDDSEDSSASVDDRRAQLQRNLDDKNAAKRLEKEAAKNAKDDKIDLL